MRLITALLFLLSPFGGHQFDSTAPSIHQPFDVISTYVGKPASGGLIYAATILQPVSFGVNFTGSWVNCVVANPTSTATYTVKKNGSNVGTVVVSSSCAPTFTTSGGAAVTYAYKDLLSITAPSPQDATADTVAIALLGTR